MQRSGAGQGNKTHEQFQRTLERKDDIPKAREADEATAPRQSAGGSRPHARGARQSEMPVSGRGMNQESRDHNKHNHPGQSGHKPQQHSPAEEKD
jgi:hypothetical protein